MCKRLVVTETQAKHAGYRFIRTLPAAKNPTITASGWCQRQREPLPAAVRGSLGMALNEIATYGPTCERYIVCATGGCRCCARAPARARSNGRTWLPHASSWHRPRPRRQQGGIGAPFPTQGRCGGACAGRLGRGPNLAGHQHWPRAPPALVTGLTMVASTASCAPCQRGKPLHTTSMCLASRTGEST